MISCSTSSNNCLILFILVKKKLRKRVAFYSTDNLVTLLKSLFGILNLGVTFFCNVCNLQFKRNHARTTQFVKTAEFSLRQGKYKLSYLRPVSNVVPLPCRTQMIELNSPLARQLLNRLFIFVFCFRQQPFYSKELNQTSETKSRQCRAAVQLQSSHCQRGTSTTFETGLNCLRNQTCTFQ